MRVRSRRRRRWKERKKKGDDDSKTIYVSLCVFLCGRYESFPTKISHTKTHKKTV